MLGNQLMELRRRVGMTQEELAERVGVSRQTLSKWETGESSPDLDKAGRLARVFDVSLDTLVDAGRGKHAYGMVTVGADGTIRLPERARKQFGIKDGDNMILLGDEETGLALIPQRFIESFMAAVQKREE